MFRLTGCLRALRPLAVGAVFASLCGSPLAAGDADDNQGEDARREEQARKVHRSAAQYVLSPADARATPLQFHESPVMRWSNPVGGARDGAIYVWSDRHRPQAVLKLFSYDGDQFNHEWQSLAEGAIVAERGGAAVWNPTGPGVTFRELPDAPRPAESAAARLRQMKSLAGMFNATATGLARDTKPTELRLLIQPLFRIEPSSDPPRPDGALFAFAAGTDPLGLLLLEARRTKEGDRWHYAFTRMTQWAVTAQYGGKEVYSAGKYDLRQDPKEAFLPLARQPVPKE
jgi:hypothetical protein